WSSDVCSSDLCFLHRPLSLYGRLCIRGGVSSSNRFRIIRLWFGLSARNTLCCRGSSLRPGDGLLRLYHRRLGGWFLGLRHLGLVRSSSLALGLFAGCFGRILWRGCALCRGGLLDFLRSLLRLRGLVVGKDGLLIGRRILIVLRYCQLRGDQGQAGRKGGCRFVNAAHVGPLPMVA